MLSWHFNIKMANLNLGAKLLSKSFLCAYIQNIVFRTFFKIQKFDIICMWWFVLYIIWIHIPFPLSLSFFLSLVFLSVSFLFTVFLMSVSYRLPRSYGKLVRVYCLVTNVCFRAFFETYFCLIIPKKFCHIKFAPSFIFFWLFLVSFINYKILFNANEYLIKKIQWNIFFKKYNLNNYVWIKHHNIL